jgi:hypothetical protein
MLLRAKRNEPATAATVPVRGNHFIGVKAMATMTKTRKQSKSKVQRSLRVGPLVDGVRCLVITDTKGERCGYSLREIPVDFGRGFELTKFEMEQADDEDRVYHVNLDATDATCTCKGACYTGHCKHSAAVMKLVSLGTI